VGQIKKAVQMSKERGFISSFSERLFNHMMQASKAIKNNTCLSDGTVSVSYSVVQYIREHVENFAHKKYLVIGTGEIGTAACRNLSEYLGINNITVVNRTREKAEILASELNLSVGSFENISVEVAKADVVIVSSVSSQSIINAGDLNKIEDKLIIDLSIPFSVDRSLADQQGITLVNVDELSAITNATMMHRIGEVPKAKNIIAETNADFMKWYGMRKQTAVLNEVKNKLHEISHNPNFVAQSGSGNDNEKHSELIQKVVSGMAYKMKEKNQRGCQYLEAINEFMNITAK
jgi:glutamyl-tRNA reductase